VVSRRAVEIVESAVASAQEVRLARRMGAPSRMFPEHAHQHLGGVQADAWVHRRGGEAKW
jgi:hypothetical protein